MILSFLSKTEAKGPVNMKFQAKIESLTDCELALLRSFTDEYIKMDLQTLKKRKGVYIFYTKQISKGEIIPLNDALDSLVQKKLIKKKDNIYMIDPGLLPSVLYAFYSRLYSLTPDRLESHDIAGKWVVLVAKKDGKVIGWLEGTLVFSPKERKAELDTIIVDLDYRKQHLGRRLVEEFEKICRESKVQFIRVDSEPSAVTFYERLGYKKRFVEIEGNEDTMLEKNLVQE